MTMLRYSEESLDKLLKRTVELIPIVLLLEEHNRTLQNRLSEMDNEVGEKMYKFNENFSKLQLELFVTKTFSIELNKRLVILERQCRLNVLYSKMECVEVVDILSQVDANIRKKRWYKSSKSLAAPLFLNS